MNPPEREWKSIADRQSAVHFWRVGVEALKAQDAQPCPACAARSLRSYAHHFGRDSSALWFWCCSCGLWTVASNMTLDVPFHDPYSNVKTDDFEKMERTNWLDRLDDLWNARDLP